MMTPPTYFIKSEGKYQYIVDGKGNKIYWLKDDYVYSLDGKTKLGHLKYYNHKDGNWYEVKVNGNTVVYVQK